MKGILSILLLICIINISLGKDEKKHEDHMFYMYDCSDLGGCSVFAYNLENNNIKASAVNFPNANVQPIDPFGSFSLDISGSFGTVTPKPFSNGLLQPAEALELNAANFAQGSSSSSGSGSGSDPFFGYNPYRLIHASEANASATFFYTFNFPAFYDVQSILRTNLNNQEIYALGAAPSPRALQFCNVPWLNGVEEDNIQGHYVVYYASKSEVGVFSTNYITGNSTYSIIGHASSCPLVSITQDRSTIYMILNVTSFVKFDINTQQVSSSKTIPELAPFFSAANAIEKIVYYDSYVYGVAVEYVESSMTTTTNIFRIDVNNPTLDVAWKYTGEYQVGRYSTQNYLPYSMYSSDYSHVIIPITSGPKFEFYIFELNKNLDHVVYTPKSGFPTGSVNYFLVYNAKEPYPKGPILGVTFGYGLTVLLILAFAFYYFYSSELEVLRANASGWALSGLSRMANGLMLVVAVLIQMITIYALATDINRVALSMIACFMEIHKAIVGVFMSFYYHGKMIPIYYVLSFLSCLFNFIAFIVINTHNEHIIDTEKGGVVFFKIISAFITIYSVGYLVYFFRRLRGSDPTSSKFFSSSSPSSSSGGAGRYDEF